MTSPLVDSTLVTETSALPLESAALRCDARAGVARVVLVQRFKNPLRETMHVIYTLPLPADAAVSGFRFRVGDRTIEGTIDKRASARERFEEAVASGQTAALLEQERSSLFTQEIGNIPPGADVVCEIELDQKLRWLEEGSWEWRFPLAAAPRYLGAAGRVADASKVAFGVAEQISARASLAMRVRDDLIAGCSPESPSHPLSTVAEGGAFRVELGSGNAVALDRDVVVRWPVAIDRADTTVDVAGPRDGRLKDAHALFTIVPPRRDAIAAAVARDLTLLLDTSGSMGGAPLEQAKRVSLAMIDSLGEHDRFEMIEFSNEPRRFQPAMRIADAEAKRAAASWIRSLRASGGTEMREGILEALRPRGERKRDDAIAQVVLVTDGLIGFEQEIVREIASLLPGDARLHTVGVGSSVNRALTGPAARAGRGVEVVIGLGEDPERAIARLVARSALPVVTEIEAFGGALLELAPAKVPDLFAGAPVLLSARVRPEGGEIVLRGKSANGTWEERVRIPAAHAGEGSDAVATLFGREHVEDVEMRVAAGLAPRAADAAIESVGLAYRIATRLTSWVAIDSSKSVDPRDPTRRIEQPQALPYGTSVESFGLRGGAQPIMHQAFYGAPVLGRAAPPAAGAPPPPAMRVPPMPARPRASARSTDDASKKEDENAKREPSFLSRVAGAFTGRAKTTLVWIARIAIAKPGEIVLEIVVDGATLAWKVTHRVEALVGGVRRELAVDIARTTRDGTYESGTTVRLVLQVPPDFDVSHLSEVWMAGVEMTVRA